MLDDFEDMWASVEEPEKKDFEPLPQGTYHVEIEEAVIDVSRDPASVKWQYKVTDGDYLNRKLWKRNYMTPKALPFLKQDLNALGVKVEKASHLPEALEQLLGKSVEVAVSHRTYNGKTYEDVYVNKLIDRNLKVVEEDVLF